MLPPFIIEQIRRKEEEEARREQERVLELPIHAPEPQQKRPVEGDAPRGVVIIDLKNH